MASFVLVHGAWHGGWCWTHVARELRAAGHKVATPDLPGHGDDRTPLTEITLESYVSRIRQTLADQPEPSILAGHSMGGLVITQTAEACPELIRTLAYVTAFAPRNGESLSQLSLPDSGSLLNQNRIVDRESGRMSVRPEGIDDVFYHDCPVADIELAHRHLVPAIALAPVITPVSTTAERFGVIPRVYVECTEDRAIRPVTQRQQISNNPMQAVFTLPTGHSPFFAAPQELTRILLSLL